MRRLTLLLLVALLAGCGSSTAESERIERDVLAGNVVNISFRVTAIRCDDSPELSGTMGTKPFRMYSCVSDAADGTHYLSCSVQLSIAGRARGPVQVLDWMTKREARAYARRIHAGFGVDC